LFPFRTKKKPWAAGIRSRVGASLVCPQGFSETKTPPPPPQGGHWAQGGGEPLMARLGRFFPGDGFKKKKTRGRGAPKTGQTNLGGGKKPGDPTQKKKKTVEGWLGPTRGPGSVGGRKKKKKKNPIPTRGGPGQNTGTSRTKTKQKPKKNGWSTKAFHQSKPRAGFEKISQVDSPTMALRMGRGQAGLKKTGLFFIPRSGRFFFPTHQTPGRVSSNRGGTKTNQADSPPTIRPQKKPHLLKPKIIFPGPGGGTTAQGTRVWIGGFFLHKPGPVSPRWEVYGGATKEKARPCGSFFQPHHNEGSGGLDFSHPQPRGTGLTPLPWRGLFNGGIVFFQREGPFSKAGGLSTTSGRILLPLPLAGFFPFLVRGGGDAPAPPEAVFLDPRRGGSEPHGAGTDKKGKKTGSPVGVFPTKKPGSKPLPTPPKRIWAPTNKLRATFKCAG